MSVNPKVKLLLASRYGTDYSEPIKVFGLWVVCERGIYGLRVTVSIGPEWYDLPNLKRIIRNRHKHKADGFAQALDFARKGETNAL